MKKNVFYLMLVLSTLFSSISVMEMNAQVTIGKDTVPHPGAVLELRSSKGLLLPKVSLTNTQTFQLSSAKQDEASAVGMIVYNENANVSNGKGVGIYVWNGGNWTLVAKSEKYFPVKSVTINAKGNATTVAPNGGTLQFSATFSPDNATNKGLIWDVNPSSAGSINSAGLFTAGPATVDVIISAKSAADQAIVSNKIAIKIDAGSSNSVNGANGTYSVREFGNAGTWMVDGSKEGSPSYPEKVTSGGAYYSFDQAQNACPNGYTVPTKAQLENLLTYLTTASSEEKAAWKASASVGYYVNGTHATNKLCYLWTNNAGFYYYYNPESNLIREESNDIKAPVRCIKQ